MLFNSWVFFILLIVSFLCYYAPISRGRYGKSWQVNVILVASVIFYGWEDPSLITLLAFSCIANSVAACRIIDHRVAGELKQAAYWTKAAVALNIVVLCVFKYLPFFVQVIPLLPASLIASMKSIPLPIGVSFYTFHGISMIVDVSRSEVSENVEKQILDSTAWRFTRGLRNIGFYLVFFPQLIAGPIVKAKDFWPQISTKSVHDIPWRLVIRALVTGYFLKVFVADNLSEQTSLLAGTAETIAANSPLNLIALLYCYSFQIFADFAGYSLIATGFAALFGYRFPRNFNFPYISTSITEFWRRWHMSLSAWLRDYLYIPLGGNRRGPTRTYINLLIVMLLGGLWHGAEWKFVIWGGLHGLFLAVERFGNSNPTICGDRSVFRSLKTNWIVKIVQGFLTFNLVTVLWLTFLMKDISCISTYFSTIARPDLSFTGPPLFCLAFYGSSVVLYHLIGWISEHKSSFYRRVSATQFEPIIHGVMLFLIVTNPGAPRGFIYFQF